MMFFIAIRKEQLLVWITIASMGAGFVTLFFSLNFGNFPAVRGLTSLRTQDDATQEVEKHAVTSSISVNSIPAASATVKNHDGLDKFRRRNLEETLNISLCPIGRSFAREYSLLPNEKLAEVSYMVHSSQTYKGQEVVWIGSDKKQDEIHAVSLDSGELLQTYKLWVHRRGDWESIALGPCTSDKSDKKTCLYILDGGDNAAQRCHTRFCGDKGERRNLYIFKFPEPDISQLDTYDGTPIRVVIIRYNYKDPSWPTNHADMEAMFVDWTGDNTGGGKKGDIYLMTKQPRYRMDQRIGKIPARLHENLRPETTNKGRNDYIRVLPVGKASIEIPWTGADISSDGTLIAARRESTVYFFSRDVEAGQTVLDAMSRKPCAFSSKTDRSDNNRKQSEAIAFLGGGSKYIFAETSECYQKKPCLLPVPSYQLLFSSDE